MEAVSGSEFVVGGVVPVATVPVTRSPVTVVSGSLVGGVSALPELEK